MHIKNARVTNMLEHTSVLPYESRLRKSVKNKPNMVEIANINPKEVTQ